MTRTLAPWFARVPRLLDFELEMPKWMTEAFGPEPGFGSEGRFLPEANVVETEKTVEVSVNLPGMKPADVKVEVKENVLSIRGEKKEEKEEKGKTFHRIERRTGMFSRRLPLPTEVIEDEVEARFVEGVLKITLPKTRKDPPKQIEVKG